LPIADLQGRTQVLLVKIDALADQVKSITASIPSPEEIDQLIENPPPALREKFFTPDGKAILYAHVRSEWLWDSVLYDEFTRQASRISDDFLGLPMFRATLETYMKRDFWWSTGLAILIIFIVLRLDFAQRGMRAVTWLSLLTLGLGYLWLLGTMGLFKIDFNVANVLLSPLLIGLGVDNCVYLLHRYRDFGGRSIERAIASTGLPILANTLATMIGFGSLMLAETPVLRVLGESAVMGIGFMTLLSLTFLPAVISLRRR
jgi:predicted RND superfamily exporter protein